MYAILLYCTNIGIHSCGNQSGRECRGNAFCPLRAGAIQRVPSEIFYCTLQHVPWTHTHTCCTWNQSEHFKKIMRPLRVNQTHGTMVNVRKHPRDKNPQLGNPGFIWDNYPFVANMHDYLTGAPNTFWEWFQYITSNLWVSIWHHIQIPFDMRTL